MALPKKKRSQLQDHYFPPDAESPLSDRKRVILFGALEIINEEGLQNLSITSIMRRTGTSKSLILYHYVDLDSILLALFEHMFGLARKSTKERSAEKSGFPEKVTAGQEVSLEWFKEYPLFGHVSLFSYALSHHHPEIKLAMTRAFLAAEEAVRKTLHESGRFTGAQAERLARVLNSAMIGQMIKAAVQEDESRRNEYHHETLELVTLLMRGSIV
jgi:AcrR family transcriptional regulator